MLEQVVNYCRDRLLNFYDATGARDYIDSRLSRLGQEHFSFGYFPTNQNLQHMIEYIGEDNLAELNLIFDKFDGGLMQQKNRYSPLENHNLIMPYKDVYGNIIAIVGRSILSDQERRERKISKYKNTSFSKGSHLFGLFEAKKSIIANDIAYVVEGQFDCISAHDKGLINIVALGGSNMSFDQFSLLMRYTNNIMLLLDNDDAGRLGSEKIIRMFSDKANIKIGKLPTLYKDLDEFLSENGTDSVKLLI
jgi:DNA primase catalytic core